MQQSTFSSSSSSKDPEQLTSPSSSNPCQLQQSPSSSSSSNSHQSQSTWPNFGQDAISTGDFQTLQQSTSSSSSSSKEPEQLTSSSSSNTCQLQQSLTSSSSSSSSSKPPQSNSSWLNFGQDEISISDFTLLETLHYKGRLQGRFECLVSWIQNFLEVVPVSEDDNLAINDILVEMRELVNYLQPLRLSIFKTQAIMYDEDLENCATQMKAIFSKYQFQFTSKQKKKRKVTEDGSTDVHQRLEELTPQEIIDHVLQEYKRNQDGPTVLNEVRERNLEEKLLFKEVSSIQDFFEKLAIVDSLPTRNAKILGNYIIYCRGSLFHLVLDKFYFSVPKNERPAATVQLFCLQSLKLNYRTMMTNISTFLLMANYPCFLNYSQQTLIKVSTKVAAFLRTTKHPRLPSFTDPPLPLELSDAYVDRYKNKVRVRRSIISGYGLFAAQDFKKGDLIVPMTGEKLTEKMYRNRYPPDGKLSPDYVISLKFKGRMCFIDAASPTYGPGRYANSCKDIDVEEGRARGNNSIIHQRLDKKTWLGLYATQDIEKDEEILCDYAPAETTEGPIEAVVQDVAVPAPEEASKET